MPAPQTGEVYLAQLEPVRGSEQGKKRPVIVFQNPNLSRFTTTSLCVPLTTNLKRLGLPGTCHIQQGEGGLAQEGVALAFQLRALDVSRLGKRYGKLSAPATESVADAILDAFGIQFGKP
jgi:mRNA interferase MazF